MPEKKPRKSKLTDKDHPKPDLSSVTEAMRDLPEGISLIGVQTCPCGRALILYIPKPDMIEVEGVLVPSAHLPWEVVAQLLKEVSSRLRHELIENSIAEIIQRLIKEQADGQ